MRRWWGAATLPPALVAVAAAFGVWLVQWIALRTVRGQQIDENVTQTAVAAGDVRLTTLARAIGDV